MVEETVTAGAPEISAIVEDLFSMDSVACLGAETELDVVPTSRYLYRV